MEEIVQSLSTLDPVLIYALVLGIALVENIFPPAPSDIMIVFGGSLVALGQTSYIGTLLSATAGSTLGFLIMFKAGEWLGVAYLEQGKLRFLSKESVHRVQAWFARYGYWLIVVNRFLSGTRAVISFAAGLSHLRPIRTTVLCFMSALTWNAILVTAGYYLGRNWERIGFYLSAYSQVVTAILITAALVLAGRYFLRGRSKDSGGSRG